MELSLKELQDLETEMLAEIADICHRYKISYYLGYGSVLGAVRHKGPIPWDSDVDIVVPINEFNLFLKKLREELPDKFYVDYYDFNPKYQGLFPRMGLKGYSTKTLHVDIFKLIGTPPNKKDQRKVIKRLKLLTNLMKAKQRTKEYYRNKIDCVLFYFYKTILFLLSSKNIAKMYEEVCVKYSYTDSNFVMNANEGYKGKEVLSKNVYGYGTLIDYENHKVRIPKLYDEYLTHFYGDYMKLPEEKDRVFKNSFEINKTN